MAQLTADLVRSYRSVGKSRGFKVGASGVLFMGAATIVVNNRAAHCDGAVGSPFGGFLERGVDNTGGADGEVTAQLIEECDVLLDVTGVISSTPIGTEVFAQDSNFFQTSPAVGRAVRVGVVAEYVADGKAWVHAQSAVLAGLKNRTT